MRNDEQGQGRGARLLAGSVDLLVDVLRDTLLYPDAGREADAAGRRPAPHRVCMMLVALWLGVGASALHATGPVLARLEPPGGRAGSTVRLEIVGAGLHGDMKILGAVPGAFTPLTANENGDKRRPYLLEIDPDDSVATFGLGKAYVQLGQHADAIPHLRRATEVRKDYSAAYLELGKCHQAIGENEAAAEAFHAGIAVAARQGDLMPLREMERRLKEIEAVDAAT